MIPVPVEAARHRRHQRSDRQHIQIDVIAVIGLAEIRIAQIASAHNPRDVICQKQLVVHAMLQPRKILQRRQRTQLAHAAPRRQRIEQPHLHIRHKRQLQHLRILALGMQIIQQDAHPHPARRRLANCRQQYAGPRIVVNGVILQIQRARRLPGQGEPARKSTVSRIQQQKPRIVPGSGLLAQGTRQLAQRSHGSCRESL